MNIVKWVTGILKIKGDTDDTKIGNVSDALKVDIASTGGIAGDTPGATYLNISKGLVPGHSEDHKYGRLPVIGNNQTIDLNLFGNLYSKQTASTLTIASDDANDTFGGTGANMVAIYGLDTDFEPITDVVALNGTTSVTTNLSFLRVNRVRVAVQGTSDSNEGVITLDDSGNIMAQIDVGKGSTEQTYFTVPANTSYYITHVRVSAVPSSGVGSKVVQAEIFVRPPGGAWIQFGSEGVSSSGSTAVFPPTPPLRLQEKHEFTLKVTSFQNTTQVNGLVQYIIVDES